MIVPRTGDFPLIVWSIKLYSDVTFITEETEVLVWGLGVPWRLAQQARLVEQKPEEDDVQV